MAKTLSRIYGSLDALKESTLEELLEINDVGPVVASSIYEWFRNENKDYKELYKSIVES